MRRDLEHLPVAARAELHEVVRIIFAEFEDALAGRNAPHRKAGRILKIILFGSYARGDWVADPIGRYFSDFDILVVVNHEELVDGEYWSMAEDRLVREHDTGDSVVTPVNLIVHSLADIDRQLKRGRPFFTEIVRDGIALYEAPDHPFVQSKPLSPAESHVEALRYFDEWFPSAQKRYEGAQFYLQKGYLKDAAFDLHQASERLYHCILLVFTLYSTKSHKLNFLRSRAESLSPALIDAWPRKSRFEQRCFELLRRAYVEARYSPHYKITPDELDWLVGRVGVLLELGEAACRARLEDAESLPGG